MSQVTILATGQWDASGAASPHNVGFDPDRLKNPQSLPGVTELQFIFANPLPYPASRLIAVASLGESFVKFTVRVMAGVDGSGLVADRVQVVGDAEDQDLSAQVVVYATLP